MRAALARIEGWWGKGSAKRGWREGERGGRGGDLAAAAGLS